MIPRRFKRVITSIAQREYKMLSDEANNKGLCISAMVCMIIKERYPDEA